MQLMQRLPKLRKHVEKEGVPSEQITFITVCNKHNEHGKVQARMLVISDNAVYNMSINGQKCKRRIPLSHIGLVTASEQTGQFVLHVPSEYDYHYSTVSRGWSLLDDDVPSSPLAAVLDALQRSYASQAGGQAQHLPIRTFNEAGPLSSVVMKKRVTSDSDDIGLIGFAGHDSDD